MEAKLTNKIKAAVKAKLIDLEAYVSVVTLTQRVLFGLGLL